MFSHRRTVAVPVDTTGVRKTSLILCERATTCLATGANVLVVTPTTASRSQAVAALLRSGSANVLRVLGVQRLSPEERTLTLDNLICDEMAALSAQVGQASADLTRELEAWQAGASHDVAGAHQAVVACRELAGAGLGPAKASVLEQRRLCCATVGALLAAPPLPRIDLLALDEAGIMQAADFAFLVLSLSPYLSPSCWHLSFATESITLSYFLHCF